jgi:hypothetical protein
VPEAKGKVKVTTLGSVEVMDVKIEGLLKNTEFYAFIILVPNFPFGMSWYQGDIQTNHKGNGYARFVGRFNEETFIVAPSTPAVAPLTHSTDAVKAGCQGATTPFNGEHTAGQILNTCDFPDDKGPLLKLKP